MNNLGVQDLPLKANTLLQSQEIINTVKIRIDTNVNDYHREPSGLQTLTASYESLSPRLIEFNLPSDANLREIYEILRHDHSIRPRLSIFLTLHIGRMAKIMGLGVNSFVLNVVVKLTYERVGFNFSDLPVSIGGEASEDGDVVERLVIEGKIDKERLKNLDLESEACSICFEKLMGTLDKAPTRMSCSHVFHDRCISQWLRRKYSCPLCREVLYVGR